MTKLIRIILLCIFFAGLRGTVFAQDKNAVMNDFLRMVGETDTTTGEVTGAIMRTWINNALREFGSMGAFVRETSYVAASGRDSFSLPIDFIGPQRVRKTIAGRAHDYLLSDSGGNFYERTDTVAQSNTIPNVNLTADVVEVRTCYRKNLADGQIKPLIRIPPESLGRIANTPSDYYYFIGQPFPRLVFGKKASFGDTVFAEVVATLPSYAFQDTGTVATSGRGWLLLFPPPTRADTIKLTYLAELDTMASVGTTATGIQNLPPNVRPALPKYMAEKYYKKHGMEAEGKDYEAQWKEILITNAILRGIKVALPK